MASEDLLLRITGDSSSAERALIRAEQAQRRYDLAIKRARSEMDADFAKRVADEEAAQARRREAAAQVGKGMLIAGAAIAAGFGYAITAGANFDQAMSGVEATGKDAAGSIEALRKAALELGADTQFSATQVAGAEAELAKAGVSAADVLGGALKGALDLAAAGQLDVADAAQFTATALTQFHLRGDQAAHVADLLAAGAGKAQGEVIDMATALNYAGLPAHALGVSIEETSGAIALFASNGLIGQQAGTSLRGVLSSLTSPSKAAKKELAELGVTLFDSSGKFVGLAGLAQQLNAALGDATDAERSMALGVIFGNAQLQAANILVDSGAKGIDEWTAKVNDQGFAADVAATKMDNLRGDLEKLKGSLETAAISAGESMQGPLRDLVQWLGSVVDGWNDLSPAVQNTILVVAGLAGAVLLLGGGFLALLPRIAATKLAMAELNVSMATAKGAVGGLTGAAGAFIAVPVAAQLAVWIGHLNDVTYSTEQLTNSLKALGETGETVGVLNDLAKSMDGLIVKGHTVGDVLRAAADAQFSFTGKIESFLSPGQDWAKVADDVDASLAELVQSGHAEAAASVFRDLQLQVEESGVSYNDFIHMFGDYLDAAGGATEATEDATDAMKDYTPVVEDAADAQEKLDDSGRSLMVRLGLTADAAGDLADEIKTAKRNLDDLNGANVTALEAQSRYESALDDSQAAIADVTKHQKDYTDAVLAGGVGFNLADEKGRDLLDTLLAQRDAAATNAQAIFDATGDYDAYTAALGVGRDQLISVAKQMGLNQDAAEKLADQILKIPDDHNTDVTLTIDDLIADAATSNAKIASIPVSKLTKLEGDPSGVVRAADEAQRAIDSIHGRTIFMDLEWLQGHLPETPFGDRSQGSRSQSQRSAQERGGLAGTLSLPAGGFFAGQQFGAQQFGAQGAQGAPGPKTVNVTINNPLEQPSSTTLGAARDLIGALA